MNVPTFVTANNITLHVVASLHSKDSIPIVFINSLGSDLRSWDEVVVRLSSDYPVIRYDKRGHGLSDCPQTPYSIADHTQDLLGLIDELEVRQVMLVGISVGGMIAIDFCAKYPERVKATVLSDTLPKIGTEDLWSERIDILRKHGMAYLGDAILERWFAPAYKDANPIAYQGYYNMLTRMPVAGYTGTCEAIRDADLTDSLKFIKAPTLVLCGEEDPATQPQQVRQLADLIENAQYVQIKNAGHLPCIENPDDMADAIQRFLNDVMPDDRYANGMKVRREVLGDAHVDKAQINTTEFDADFQHLITEFAWGSTWTRGTLNRQTRHLLTIAMLVVLGKENELAMHIRATQNTGVTSDQVKEVFLQAAIYGGVPVANTGFVIAKQVYSELGVNLNKKEE